MDIARKKTVLPCYRLWRAVMFAMIAWGCDTAFAATAPGPDAFGYTVTTTSDYSFTNITNNITAKRTLVLVDDAAVTVNIGFTFNFYGSNYTTVSICENGFLTFGGTNASPTNPNLTTDALIPDLPTIAVFWDDWETLTAQRPVFYDTAGPIGSREFIVQWERVVAVDPLTGFDPVTFQVRLFEGNNSILFSYPDVVLTDGPGYGLGANQTVGIRDRGGQSNNRNLQWTFNQEALSNDQDLLFTRPNTPPLAVDDSIIASEDLPAIIEVLANDTDPDANFLTVVAVTQPTNGTVMLLTNNNTVRYNPFLDFRGEDHFTYTISDGQGGFATGVVAILVIDQNDPPVGVPDEYRLEEDTILSIAAPGVVGNDFDQESPALTAVLVREPLHGSVALNPDGSFAYIPATNYFGLDDFIYRANDGNLRSSNTLVTIRIDPINDPPVAHSTIVSTPEDSPLNVRPSGTDPDGDPLSITLLSIPANGFLSGVVPDLTYHPGANFHGPDVFTFAVDDGHGLSSSGTMFVTVTPINEYPPVARDDMVRVLPNTALIITNDTLLANDSDADIYDFLTITDVPATTTVGATLVLTPDTITYTPPTNFIGWDTFTYVVSDGLGGSATGIVRAAVSDVRIVSLATTTPSSALLRFEGSSGNSYNVEASSNFVQWAVLGPGTETSAGLFEFRDSAASPPRFYRIARDNSNRPPVGRADSYQMFANDILIIPPRGVLANDTDSDGDVLSAVLVAPPAHGNLTLRSDGSFTYLPAANYSGTDQFAYVANDGKANSAQTVVTITIVP